VAIYAQEQGKSIALIMSYDRKVTRVPMLRAKIINTLNILIPQYPKWHPTNFNLFTFNRDFMNQPP
jgi:hypothetical protein